MNGYRSRCEFYVLAGTGTLVRTHAVNGNGGICGRGLHLVPQEASKRIPGERLLEQACVDRHLARRLAFRIVGHGLASETDLRHIALNVEGEHAEQARRLPDAHDHDACCKRIEGSRMPHAPLPHRTPYARHDVVRRDAERLIDRDESVELCDLASSHGAPFKRYGWWRR